MKPDGFLRGRPEELHILDYGLFQVHANRRIIGICGFLIRTDAGEAVLVDTGFPEKYARDVEKASAEDRLGEFGQVLELTAGNLPESQLALSNTRSQDVDLLILTHTHIDHIGGVGDFSGVPILMARAERQLPKPLYWGDIQPVEWPDREYLLVDDDVEIGPGFHVLFAPGHTPGQLALLVDLPESGAMLLVSDAISRPAEIDEGFSGAWDEAQARTSADRLMNLSRETGATVIYGHCPQQWPQLRKTPDAFR